MLSQKLPGSVSHRRMLPSGRELFPGNINLNHLKHSSVLLLLFIDHGELNACLIKRPEHMKHHAGQVALPGGRIEDGETALQTALRETYEEIGISSAQIEILGILSELYVQVSGFLIHPFVGWLKEKPFIKINKNEVEKTVSFPLKNLMENIDETELNTVSGLLTVPCIKFEGEIIWGATAMILSEFADLLRTIETNN